MDKINKYRQIIRETLLPYSKDHYVGSLDIRNEVIFDKENDHYLVVTMGWEKDTPVRDCIFHIDIINGKIWIQEDNSDSDIASILIDEGIPKSEIVLGFQPPSMRRFSTYAIS
jgi:hypothetical protein